MARKAGGVMMPTLDMLHSADVMATRWLYVRAKKTEEWYEKEPLDLPAMEVKFVRIEDGTIWQVVSRRRVKLHDRFNTELYPPPHGRGWKHAGEGYIAQIYTRPASAALLKRLKVMSSRRDWRL